MSVYGYYPGCSLERNAGAYQQSTMAIAPLLNLTFREIDDWNCCGATEYISLKKLPAHALIGRNLALAAAQASNGSELVAPCSACFLNLRKTDHTLRESPAMARQVNEALSAGGLHYEPGSVTVRHLLEIVVEDVGYDAVAEKVTEPLAGLRVAPYYGCLIVRPALEDKFDDAEYPKTLDKLMKVLGAKVVDYPVKAHCCGGHMTQISEPIALELIRRLLKNAADYEADVIVTLCPMCQLNLDAYQDAVNDYFGTDFRIPVLYFTQLMGLAFGLTPDQIGIGQELVDARPALAKVGKVGEETPAPRRRGKKKDEGLPMPASLEERVR